MEKTKLIKFSQPWGIHNAGESAGFPEQQADHLVAHGVAAHVADVEKEAQANKAADDKDRAANKKRAPAATKAGAALTKKKEAAAAAEAKAQAKADDAG